MLRGVKKRVWLKRRKAFPQRENDSVGKRGGFLNLGLKSLKVLLEASS